MEIVNAEFQDLIVSSVNQLQLEDCVEPEEFRLAKELNSLPIGYDLSAFVFLKPDGEVVSYNFCDEKVGSSRDLQVLIRIVVSAAKRYPQFEKFIPARPANAEVCLACNGTKLWGTDVTTNQPAKCVICAGLGWTIKERQEQ
jgi:hypothetical protein